VKTVKTVKFKLENLRGTKSKIPAGTTCGWAVAEPRRPGSAEDVGTAEPAHLDDAAGGRRDPWKRTW
jgi:hypothetical protein